MTTQHTLTLMTAALAFAEKSLNDACLCETLAKEDRSIAYMRGSQSYNAAGELEFGFCVVDHYATLSAKAGA